MRRTVEAPYLRGEETRTRILLVAVDLFGTKGFDSVTTREIAAAAAVPQASLRYYFENKQGLYIACLEQIQSRIFRQMQPALHIAEALLANEATPLDNLIDSFCALQEALVDAMIGGRDGGSAALLLIRHDLPSQSGYGALHGDEAAIQRVLACFAGMINRISGNRLDVPSARRIAGLINGQLTNIYLRRSRLADEDWEITPDRLLWIKHMIRQQTKAILQDHRGVSDQATSASRMR